MSNMSSLFILVSDSVVPAVDIVPLKAIAVWFIHVKFQKRQHFIHKYLKIGLLYVNWKVLENCFFLYKLGF